MDFIDNELDRRFDPRNFGAVDMERHYWHPLGKSLLAPTLRSVVLLLLC